MRKDKPIVYSPPADVPKRTRVEPTKPLTDLSFGYTSSVDTNLKKTFARVRREMRKAEVTAEKEDAVVVPLKAVK